jgi:hypothetical protein
MFHIEILEFCTSKLENKKNWVNQNKEKIANYVNELSKRLA